MEDPTYDPNTTQAAPGETTVAPAEAMIDPATGQPVGPMTTMTFAEWCAVDPSLRDADKAAFDQFYGHVSEQKMAEREAREAAEDEAGGSAFATYYPSGAEQKMDRGTLDARIAAMTTALEAAAADAPPADPDATLGEGDGSDQHNPAGAIPVYVVAGGGGVPPAGVRALRYQAMAASVADTKLGPTGAIGDILNFLLVVPLSTAPGQITIKDGSGGAAQVVFQGGVGSVNSLVPFVLPLDAPSITGPWFVTTGANVRVYASGSFT
jgi:hypothetical protein